MSVMITEEVEAFLNALAGVPDAYLECRSMKHAWQQDTLFTLVDTGRETSRRARGGERVFAERNLTCLRCGMERSDAYRVTKIGRYTALKKLTSTYTPPEGYYVKGAGRLGAELVLGAKFDRDTNVVPIKGRKRRGA